ncbi:MAG TPA: Uma2 family endonuclease [Candidatus Xenobia bacterium]
MPITETPYTIEDMDKLRLADDYELDRGVLVPVSPGKPRHGSIGVRVGARILTFVEAYGLGETYGLDTGFVLGRNPDTLRGPDVAFMSHARLAGHPDEDTWFEGGPELAVEVLSRGDRPGQVKRKVIQYLQAGSRLVWVFDPRRKRVHIYRQNGTVQVLGGAATLDGEDVLPGFQLPLSDAFR